MTRSEYQDWHKEASQKITVFLVQEIGRLESADLGNRRVLSKIVVGAFWGKAKDLVSRLAPKVLDRVLDCVSDVSLNDLASVLGYTKERGR